MVLTIADSIAVKILHKNAILAAIGNELHLHRTPSKCKKKDDVLSQNETTWTEDVGTKLKDIQLRGKVHGIVSGDASGINAQHAVIYGENEFILVAWAEPEYQFRLLYRAELSDWINAATFLEDNGQQFLLHTAHSVALRFTYSDKQVTLLERISCTDKSTLYTTHLQGRRWLDLVIFSGNAFGELLIWQPANNSLSAVGKCVLLQRLSAHNGVIFSIDYCADAQLLTTTSDDRSIKFWQVSISNGNWQEAKLQPLISGFGHTSRVFRGGIIEHDGQHFAITVGEDSYICLWRTNGELLFKRRQHYGATIWNYAYEKCTRTLYTVCSIGNIVAYNLQDIFNAQKQQQQVGRILAPSNDSCIAADEYLAKVKFLTHDLLIGVSNKNRLLYAVIDQVYNADTISWHAIDDFNRYKCTVLEVHDGKFVLCGYKRITFYAYFAGDGVRPTFKQLYDGDMLDGAIRAFHFLQAKTYLACDEHGNCLLLVGEQLRVRAKIELPACKEPWLTTSLLIHLTKNEEYLLGCNRHGDFLFYENSNQIGFVFKQRIRQPHGYLGATCMQLLDSAKHDDHYIRTAGHDGTVRLLRLHRTSGHLDLYTHEAVPVAWIEQLTVKPEGLVLGFNDNRFVVWHRDHDFLLELPCGGGHRCWDYQLLQDANNKQCWLQVVFIKHKQLVYHNCKLFNECHSRIMLPEHNTWHVRACNVLRVLNSTRFGTIIVSAGDDNLIKTSILSADGRQVMQQCEIYAHISNVRSMRLWPESDNECLIFTGGGRAQLCITRLHMQSSFKVQHLRNYTLEPVHKLHAASDQEYKCNAETRIMCIDVARVSNCYHLYLACSDGYLRQMCLQTNNKFGQEMPLTLLHAINFERCLLQVRLIAGLVLVAGTDGKLSIHKLGDLNQCLLVIPLHTSGINALDTLMDTNEQILHLLSGGDDQNVVYTTIDVGTVTQPPRMLHKQALRQLHNAQVTAVALRWHLPKIGRNKKINFPAKCQLYAYTSGVDQRLNVYNVSEHRLEYNFYSCVPDIKGVSVDKQQRCYLYGCGLQVIPKLNS